MKKLLLIIGFLLTTILSANADHVSGGEISYEYLGKGNGNSNRYRISAKLYLDCVTGAELTEIIVSVAVFQNGNDIPFVILDLPQKTQEYIYKKQELKCISDPPSVCYILGVYVTEVELPSYDAGYSLMYSNCCRTEDLVNILNPLSTGTVYSASIPGIVSGIEAFKNSSPLISSNDTVVICAGSYFEYTFEASDKENDLLRYGFAEAYDWFEEGRVSQPPYYALNYNTGFSYVRPLGEKVKIDSLTGLISGIAPHRGVYVITVAIREFRAGILINTHRKDIHIRVAPCTIAEARLEPEYVLCKGPIAFRNLNTSSLIKTFHWDFGVDGNADTSSLEAPVFHFPDTGVYHIRLITNMNMDCSDTAYAIVKNYAAIEGKMEIQGGCINNPVLFADRSIAGYGSINYRKWYFGSPSIHEDSSVLSEPAYTYTQFGTYSVRLVVGNTIGCRDTVTRALVIKDKPLLTVSNDTLICSLDSIRLRAVGDGAVKWSPEYMINNSSVPDPLVSPDLSTKYFVTLTSSPGCYNTDSIFVEVKQTLALELPADTAICLNDTLTLNVKTDGTSILWSPATNLNDPTAKRTTARVQKDLVIYTVSAKLGTCEAVGRINVRGIPYPTANAGADTAVCIGNSVKLQASGGTKYIWTPALGLSDPLIADPVASPRATTFYKLTVYDNKGCSKPSFDSLLVQVHPIPNAFAGNDTMVISGNALKLTASGGINYVWQPATGLTNVNIADPVATLTHDMIYVVTVADNIGCAARDTIKIKVLSGQPDILVPTAFTPNNDRKNDILKPIPVGVTRLDFFRVYDRYGQMIYSTNLIGQGWDGRIQGKDPSGGIYVWSVQGVDYTGKRITKKGTVTLIR